MQTNLQEVLHSIDFHTHHCYDSILNYAHDNHYTDREKKQHTFALSWTEQTKNQEVFQ